MQWFENEAFWQTFYSYMFNEQRFSSAGSEVDRALSLTGTERGAVLDLCCGPGRHSVILAQKGFSVTGVDRSPFLLSKARETAAGVSVELVEADMRTFVRPGAFDLVLNLFTSFGYFETRDEDLSVLRNVRASLKSGGVFLIDVMSKEHLASRSYPTQWEDLPGGEVCVHHFAVLPGWARVRVEWLLVKKERAVRFQFEHNLYSGQELIAHLEKAGFSDIEIFGNLDGAPYDSAATRLVARARAN
jgi:SAM-dependent methyltransferase